MKKLVQCCHAVAALEFAIIAPVLLIVVAGLSDFGFALRARMQLDQAVANGAGYAFAAQQSLASLGKVSSQAVQSVVSASLTLPNVALSISDPGPFCVQTNSQSSPSTSSLAQGSYDSLCSNGNPAGTYMTIKAQYTYVPMMPFYSGMANTSLSATAVVRLY